MNRPNKSNLIVEKPFSSSEKFGFFYRKTSINTFIINKFAKFLNQI